METRVGIIYMYTSPSGKSYIGQTWEPKKRIQQHKTLHGYKTIFKNAILCYGFENMKYEVLHEDIKTQEELDCLESTEIKNRNTLSPNGYNLNGGGGAHGIVSEETKLKISLSNKGREMNPEHREKLIKVWTGRKHTEETKAKIRAAHIGMKATAEQIEANRKAHTGRKQSPEAIEKTRQAWIGRKHSPESIEKMSLAKKGRKHSPEAVEKIRIAGTGRKHSQETKDKMSKAHKGIPKTKEHIEKMKETKRKKKEMNSEA